MNNKYNKNNSIMMVERMSGDGMPNLLKIDGLFYPPSHDERAFASGITFEPDDGDVFICSKSYKILYCIIRYYYCT